jgi:arginyl-tRNA synthetase
VRWRLGRSGRVLTGSAPVAAHVTIRYAAAMVDPAQALAALVVRGITDAFGNDHCDIDPQVRRSERADLQADVAIGLARRLHQPPRAIADRIAAALPANELVDRVEVAGAGFLNVSVRTEWLAEAATRAAGDERLGVPFATNRERTVIDYSAPNVAKEMHVGHLRSTIIGDALARILAWRGHTVIRQNHLGDWGTPFGMLYEQDLDCGRAGGELTIGRIAELYRLANQRFETEPEFAERARRRVVTLQAGLDPETRAWWQQFIDLSTRYFETIYATLGVTLAPEDIRAESFYNDRLTPLVGELEATGRAVVSDGAVCMFPAGFTNREGNPLPLMLRKSDGGYGYGITDLAAIRYRLSELGATRLLYVVGAAQARHLAMVHAAAAELGWLVPPARATHVPFGFVLGQDRKPLRSREGGAVRLMDLIAAAIARAEQVILEIEAGKRERGAPVEELEPELRRDVARAVGVGSIKYADLSCDRVKDYVFDVDRMVSFKGDSAGYLQYAHARARGIFRELDQPATLGPIRITAPAERGLVVRLLGLGGVVRSVEATLEPHRLAGYLFDVATAFTEFYDACPVLTSTGDLRASRLALADLTARTLSRGLGLLGIAAPERM